LKVGSVSGGDVGAAMRYCGGRRYAAMPNAAAEESCRNSRLV
jgi:hypothetical protein